MKPIKTLVLLSGGIDSATALAWALNRGDDADALSFDYGQQHRIELERAEAIAEHYEVGFDVLRIPSMSRVNEVVFAGRNLVLASIGIAKAQAGGFDCVMLGCNASDWEIFPDCRPDFWRAVNVAADAYGVRVTTPLLYMSKAEIVAYARAFGVPLELTWSCYSPRDAKPCGECLACKTRQEALAA